MKKILIPLILLLTMLFVSCGNDVNTPADSTTPSGDGSTPGIEDTTAPVEEEPFMIVDHGKCDFKVIFPESPGEDVFASVKNITDTLKSSAGVTVKYASDFIPASKTHDDEAFEILVGVTNYTQSAELLAELKASDYAIVRSGNKIVVAAHTPEMLARAASYFCKNIIGKNIIKEEDGTVSIPFSDYTYIVDAPVTSLTVEGKELRNFRIVYAAEKESGYDRAAERLATLISERYGYVLDVVSDKKSTPVENEILVGPTNRAESASFEVAHPTPLLSFTMGVENGKFIICGKPYSCLQAAGRFSSHYLFDGKTCQISKDEIFSDTYMTRPVTPLAEGADIRIMTSNILAEFLSWSVDGSTTPVYERAEIFAALLESFQPDAIGIQEVTDLWDKMIPFYSGDRYEFVYKKTPDGLVNYSTILYDKTKYDLVDSGLTYFSNHGKNNIRLVTWGVFSSKTSDIKFTLFNTHWCWDSEEHAHQQAYEEAQLIKQVTAKYPYPYFCTADYNTKQETANYNYFLELTGAVDAKYVARDAGTLLNLSGGCGNLGQPRPDSGNSIDHIFMSADCGAAAFATVTWNCTWDLSDHSPKYVDVILKK